MRRISGLLFLASLGLTVGCGDDNNTSTTATTMSGTSVTTLPATTDPGSSSGDATAAPTTSEGSGSATEASGTGSTGVSATDSGSSSTTNPLTTGPDTTSSTTNMTTMTSGTTGGTPCEEIMVTVKPITPNAMLVVDKSGSMISNTWDHDANPNTPAVTRWFSLYAVVQQVLTDFDAKFNFGMNLFPSTMAQQAYNNTACPVNAQVEVPVKALNKDPILMALPAQNNMTIKGGTPAAAGITAAVNHLKTLDPMVPRLNILVTDGAANCSSNAMSPAQLFEVYDANLPTIVDNAFKNDGIPTYVIGIATSNMTTPNTQDGNPDGINPYQKLNELATLGGKPKNDPNEKFYNANNQIELSDALNAIAADALSCILPLDSEPAFPDKTVVKVNNMPVPKIMDCTKENGWKYTDPNPPYTGIELCGTACAALKMAGNAGVEYYCDAG